MSDESIWKRLTRLVRSGPVVRHKIAAPNERHIEPRGSASIYKKEVSSLYISNAALYGQAERNGRYSDYAEMDGFTPEAATALNVIADNVTTKDELGRIVRVVSENASVRQDIETLFDDILNLDFNAFSWVRNLCKWGDCAFLVDASEENGILNLLPIPINELERQEGYDKNDPYAVRFKWLTQGGSYLQNWQVIHFRMLGNDAFLPYGQSILEPARRIWRQLILIEDAMLVYRMVRSPERRVFKIPVNNIPAEEVERHIEQIKTELRSSMLVDPDNAQVSLRFAPMSMIDDYFFPTRNGEGPTVESLPGGTFTGDIDDVKYIQDKFISALQVPKPYLGWLEDMGAKATLSQLDIRFARTIERIQKVFLAELNKIAIIHLYLLGYRNEDVTNFKLEMSSPSIVDEQQRLELWRMKFEVAGMATEGMFDRESIYRMIFKLSDQQIARIKEGKRFDKLEDAALEQAAAGASTDGGAGEEPVPGEDALPSTLGGDAPDGDKEPAAETTPEGLEGLPTIVERNPGSEGDDAAVAVDKGHDLFSVTPDLHTHVFGTEKQTASDPFDRRASKRLITRPFGESKVDESTSWFERKIGQMNELSKRLDEDIGRLKTLDVRPTGPTYRRTNRHQDDRGEAS
jgi:hypothetical protein